MKVVRLSHDGFTRNDKPRKINILASIETSDWEGTTLLEGTRRLEGARMLEGVTLLGGVGLLNGSKFCDRKKLTLHNYDGPSSSLRKSVENAHALIAHTCGMMTPMKSKCNELR